MLSIQLNVTGRAKSCLDELSGVIVEICIFSLNVVMLLDWTYLIGAHACWNKVSSGAFNGSGLTISTLCSFTVVLASCYSKERLSRYYKGHALLARHVTLATAGIGGLRFSR